jgi:hypothetical protein
VIKHGGAVSEVLSDGGQGSQVVGVQEKVVLFVVSSDDGEHDAHGPSLT